MIQGSFQLDLMPTYGNLSRRTTDERAGLGERAHYFDKPGGLNGVNVLQMIHATPSVTSTNISSPQQG